MLRKMFLSIILILAMLTPGCGQTGPVTTTPSTDNTTGTTNATKPRGGELIHLGTDPPTLDPHLVSDAYSATITVEVFGGLVTLDHDLKVVPDLAENWQVSPDGKTYTFSLRRDAKFHNGKPVTANDFKWSLERAADPKTQSPTVDTYLGDVVGVREKLRGESTEITGVKVIDEHTLEITIDAPKVYFLSKLTYHTACVLDRENVEASREWFKKPNGTGPFKLKEYVPGELLILERNANYHLGAPYLDRVRFLLAGGSPMVMYENDEIQITGVGLADLDRVTDPSSTLSKELHTSPPGFEIGYIGLNILQPPLDDIKVRQALTYAINKEEIAEKVLANQVKPAYGILPPGFPAYNSDLEGLRYDPDKAKSLLAESKYGTDLTKLPRLTITVPGELGTAIGLDLEAILAMWRDTLGITVDVQQVEWATFVKDLHAYRLQMFSVGWVADYADPQDFLDLLFHSQSVNNEVRYNNPEVDRLLEAARIETDETTRFSLYRQAEETIVSDAPWIPLWHSGGGFVLIKPEAKDFPLLPMIAPKYRYVYLEK
ncbi:MAG: peptide ABC transporter substrate-binding protein [Dehalococcoidales bacterium]|nr:peptide ABC transporter substrate-binding protein [Dehalococcoidales bacterium]